MTILRGLLHQLSTASRETSLPAYHPFFPENKQRFIEQSKLDLAFVKQTCKKVWPHYPFLSYSETKAKIDVVCLMCGPLGKRDWRGRIIGQGIHGSLNALLTRIKHKKHLMGHTPLIAILTICLECCGEPGLYYEADQMDQILNETSGSLILSLSCKEVEEVVSSKVIIMEGVLMDAIKTVGMEGQWKEWYLLNKSRSIFKN